MRCTCLLQGESLSKKNCHEYQDFNFISYRRNKKYVDGLKLWMKFFFCHPETQSQNLYASLSSPRNALRRGYSNAAVALSVSVSITLWPCEHDRNLTVVCIFIKLGRHVHYDERMNPIDFRGQKSKAKVTIDIYGNKLSLVNTIEN